MFEIFKEFDEEIVTKQNNFCLTREPTDSLLSGKVVYSDEMNHSLMIDVEVKKQEIKCTIERCFCVPIKWFGKYFA